MRPCQLLLCGSVPGCDTDDGKEQKVRARACAPASDINHNAQETSQSATIILMSIGSNFLPAAYQLCWPHSQAHSADDDDPGQTMSEASALRLLTHTLSFPAKAWGLHTHVGTQSMFGIQCDMPCHRISGAAPRSTGSKHVSPSPTLAPSYNLHHHPESLC